MKSFTEVWEEALSYIQFHNIEHGEMPKTAYNVWILPIEPIELDLNRAVLGVDSEFQANITRRNYTGVLTAAISNVIGFPVEVEIISTALPVVSANDLTNDDALPEEKKVELNKTFKKAEYEYTFDTFIVGKSNQFAYAASVAVANEPGAVYNPLFIHGPSGLGKTHLLSAIAHQLEKTDSSLKVIYITGEAFTNELIDAIQHGRDTSDFHRKYRSTDVLLVDDVQFIAGKESTQEEFFHTFNELYKQKKQIVLTSDRPPKEIKTLEDRIRTRFESGILADISLPDYETRVAIIRRKAELLNLNIPDGITELIAMSLKGSIRQLEGCIKKLKAIEHLVGTPPQFNQAQNAIKEVLTDEAPPTPVTLAKILSEISRIYGISQEEILSNKRAANISIARKVACYIIKEVTPLSFKAIGVEIGNRDHSTVMYYYEDIKQKIGEDSHIQEVVKDIMRNIES
ncbi:MAG: chromosomal replication initiator protein DnaA [Ruminococcus sp.]|jgi:chromosomal replication initiator protein|nr:chromosomal replication initiator protein DnaA [Ruminococcus sp.]